MRCCREAKPNFHRTVSCLNGNVTLHSALNRFVLEQYCYCTSCAYIAGLLIVLQVERRKLEDELKSSKQEALEGLFFKPRKWYFTVCQVKV